MAIILFFVAVWRLAPRRDPVADRLRDYGYDDQLPVQRRAVIGQSLSPLMRLLNGFGQGPRLAVALAQADIAMTATEYMLIILGCGFAGVVFGTLRLNLLMGLVLGLLCAYLPILYLRRMQTRRRHALNDQLPDMLTLLVGALRSGYGLNQSISILAEQLPVPSNIEFGRVQQAVHLGVPVPDALADMAARVGSDDFDLVIAAISVQYEMGGNLAEVLETIGHTVRERIRILREVRVLTAQQRATGYVLVGTPIAVAVGLGLLNPDYFDAFFEPGPLQLLPLAAIVMVVVGFFLIQRIVSIEV